MGGEVTTVKIEIGTSDAIVIFDWLARVDFESLTGEHKSVKQALVDLFAELEQTQVAGYSHEELQAAQADVTRAMGW